VKRLKDLLSRFIPARRGSKAVEEGHDETEKPQPQEVAGPVESGKKRRRVRLKVRTKFLTPGNSISGRLLTPFSDPDHRIKLPAPIAKLIGGGRGLPIIGKRLGRISDEGAKGPHLLNRELRLPRVIANLFRRLKFIPLLGRLLVRMADGHPTTPDFRKGMTRVRFGLYGGASFLLIIFLATIQFPLTTNPTFCGSCHSQRPQFYNWKESSHGQVTCYACHVRPGLFWLVRDHLIDGPIGMLAEAELALNDYGVNGDPVEDSSYLINSSSHAALDVVQMSSCLRCHDMQTRRTTPTKGIKIDHMAHIERNIRCTWCHNRITHWKVPTHVNFMTGEACFRCHYETGDDALVGNGAPPPSEAQQTIGGGGSLQDDEHAGLPGATAAIAAEDGESHGSDPLAASQGHRYLDTEDRAYPHPPLPTVEIIKEFVGGPAHEIPWEEFKASGECTVCHVRGKL